MEAELETQFNFLLTDKKKIFSKENINKNGFSVKKQNSRRQALCHKPNFQPSVLLSIMWMHWLLPTFSQCETDVRYPPAATRVKALTDELILLRA